MQIVVPEHINHSFEKLLETFPIVPIYFTRNTIYTKPSTPSEALHEVVQLLSMISDIRSAEHSSWIEIGSILYNVSMGSRNGIQEWIAFSKRTTAFTEDDCLKAWINMKPSYHSIRILYHYAKTDNLESYTLYKQNHSKNKFQERITLYGYEILESSWAEIMYILYKDEFFYHDHWYIGDIHHWEITKECIELQLQIPKLRVIISREIKKKNDELGEINEERMDIEEKPTSHENEQKIRELDEIRKGVEDKLHQLVISRNQLEKTCFKMNIIKECKLLFYDKTILKHKDKTIVSNEIKIDNELEYTKIEYTIQSPLKLFVHYLVTNEKYKDNIILLSSDELIHAFNEFTCNYKIDKKIDNPISLILQLKKLQIKGITFGVRVRSKKTDTIKFDINKTEFNKSEIIKCL